MLEANQLIIFHLKNNFFNLDAVQSQEKQA